ncbi:MAG TPA: hypothetical protein VFJ43_18235 [Bacteroidia bacterium]|nr:hypothetical protein [Bacteroidia bacterium]
MDIRIKQVICILSLSLMGFFGIGRLSAQINTSLICTARIFNASHADQPKMDLLLNDIKAKLLKKPFNTYNCFIQMRQNDYVVIKGNPAMKIPLDGTSFMKLEYQELTAQDGKIAFVISYSMMDAKGKPKPPVKVTVPDGDNIILAIGKINGIDSFIVLSFKEN